MRYCRSLSLLVVALILTAVGLSAPAAGAEKPPINVLLIMTDQHHASALGCAGNSVVKSPNLDKLAADGVRMTNDFTPVPYCSPTRAAIVTGLWPSTLGIGRNIREADDPLRLREPRQTYLHALAAAGYRCHQLGKWHLGDPQELSCLPEGQADTQNPLRRTKEKLKAAGDNAYDSGPRPGEVDAVNDVFMRKEVAAAHDNYRRQPGTPKQDVGLIGRSRIKPEYHYEPVLADYCIELLKRHQHEPFAITYSVSPPHALWIAPAPYYDLYDPQKLPLPTTWNDRPAIWAESGSARMGQAYGEAGFREYLRCYYAQVTWMDELIGRILKTLDDLKLSDHTLMIFTSDHGNMLGQHNMMDKTHGGFYDDLMRVPMILRLPGVIMPGKTSGKLVSSVDLPATVLDYVGLKPTAAMHGKSFRPVIEERSGGHEAVFGERFEPTAPNVARMIRTERWKLCAYGNGRRELFDLKADPDEIHDVVDEPANREVLKQLTVQLRAHMNDIGDPAIKIFSGERNVKAAGKAKGR